MADVDEEEEDFVYPLSLKICWTMVFATTVVASILISLYIVVKWRKLSKHQSYLIFFVWTLFGSALIQFDRLTDMWGWLSWDYWSWGFYAFGQNLLVAPELVRASRLVTIYYPEHVKLQAKQLSSRFMLITLAVLNIPVLAFYMALALTTDEVFDYVLVTYYCLQLLLLLIATFLLWRKRLQLRRYQLSETWNLLFFATMLTILIVYDNVRYYEFQEEAYGQAALLWEYVDVISNAVFTLIVFRVWYKHIRIMWIRDFGDGFPSHTSASDYFNTDTGMGNTIQSGFNNGLRRISNAGSYVVGTVTGTMRRRATTTNLKSTDDTIVENPNSPLSHDRDLSFAIGGVRARAMTSMCMTHNTVMPEDTLIEEADEDFNKERRWSRLSKCLSHPSRSSQQYEVNQFRDLDFDAFTAAPTSSVGTFLGESIRSIGRRLSATRQLSMRSLRSTKLEGTQNANPDRRAQSLPDIL